MSTKPSERNLLGFNFYIDTDLGGRLYKCSDTKCLRPRHPLDKSNKLDKEENVCVPQFAFNRSLDNYSVDSF